MQNIYDRWKACATSRKGFHIIVIQTYVYNGNAKLEASFPVNLIEMKAKPIFKVILRVERFHHTFGSHGDTNRNRKTKLQTIFRFYTPRRNFLIITSLGTKRKVHFLCKPDLFAILPSYLERNSIKAGVSPRLAI